MKRYRRAEHFGVAELETDETDEGLAAPGVERSAGGHEIDDAHGIDGVTHEDEIAPVRSEKGAASLAHAKIIPRSKPGAPRATPGRHGGGGGVVDLSDAGNAGDADLGASEPVSAGSP